MNEALATLHLADCLVLGVDSPDIADRVKFGVRLLLRDWRKLHGTYFKRTFRSYKAKASYRRRLEQRGFATVDA
jgi:hypothetical protein